MWSTIMSLLTAAFRTSYDLTSSKSLGRENLKVVLFADSHIGTVFDGEGFAERMKKIGEENPDIVLIAGDFIDSSTKRGDMLRSCRALKFKTGTKSEYVVVNITGN